MAEKAMQALERCARAAADIDRLDPQLVEARIELHDAIVSAHSAGVSVDLLARASNLSKQRIYQIVKRTETPNTLLSVGLVATAQVSVLAMMLPTILAILSL